MAILWMDGFDTYTAEADVGVRYAGSTTAFLTLSTTLGRFGGGALSNTAAASGTQSYLGGIVFTHSGASAIIAGGAVRPASTTCGLIVFYNSLAGTPVSELTVAYDLGLIRLYRGTASGGTLLATSTQTFVPGVYHHIEAKATIADSGGTCEVRVNGTVVINFTGDTRNSTTGTVGIDRIYFTGLTGVYWDDIYVLDTSGSVCNDFIGDCRINTLAPTSDAAVQFTRSTGASNYLTVDEGRYNSDIDYVESATVGHIDRYGYTDLAAAVTTVHGVQVTTWCKKTDATVRTMRNILVSGATTSNGSSFALVTSYTPMVTTLMLNPDGSIVWTPTTVNAATAGFEVLT